MPTVTPRTPEGRALLGELQSWKVGRAVKAEMIRAIERRGEVGWAWAWFWFLDAVGLLIAVVYLATR